MDLLPLTFIAAWAYGFFAGFMMWLNRTPDAGLFVGFTKAGLNERGQRYRRRFYVSYAICLIVVAVAFAFSGR